MLLSVKNSTPRLLPLSTELGPPVTVVVLVKLMSLIDKIVETDVSPHIEQYLNVIEEKLAHLNKEELLKHFVSTEFNRFLSFYKNAPNLNINSKKEKNNERIAENGFSRFFINLGKSHRLEPQNLIGLINEYTRNRNHIIGKIDIMKNFSFFEVEKSAEKEILEGFLDSQWNGYQLTVEISKPKNDSGKRRKKNTSSERKRKEFSGNKRKEFSRGSSGNKRKSFKSRFDESRNGRRNRRR